MDFLEPINPLEQNEKKYILVVINYFSKIIFIKTFQVTNAKAIIDFWNNYLTLIFGYPIVIYTNNNNYFANYEINILFIFYNTKMIYAPIIYL